MKTKKIRLLLSSVLILGLVSGVYAQEQDKSDIRAMFGAGALFGSYNADKKAGYEEWKPGTGIGGGAVFESMFNDFFGIHTGLWFTQFKLKLAGTETRTEDVSGVPTTTVNEYEFQIKSNMFTLPVYLMSGYSFRFFSAHLLTGLNFSYVSESFLSFQDQSQDILRYENHGQLGVGGGLEFKFRILRFVHLFVSGIGEYYLTSILAEDPEMRAQLYDFTARAGILLSTF